ncbi:DNA alkylation repair protein [Viridibacillus sp. YIM B01967]|uniref:DNA alkylation repair protein n=1 Tax=Viridibacillus soli TaxID=2798301 RepID=A0ABS1HCN5_9BACL|nr:DNA alkylation repair protein [Viridibacillus soli]MBK3496857.1 DNA alkylation repair protein [Viridibacillus soli]
MAELLKHVYNEALFKQFCEKLKQVYPLFDEQYFMTQLFDEEWAQRELKQRTRHISHTLGATLPQSYAKAIDILSNMVPECKGFEYLFLPDFIEVYGLSDWETSIPALKLFTISISAEFAVRPFIEQNPERMMAIMEEWAVDDSEHVRRLASEGCRPRLPWAAPLTIFKVDPSPIIPILQRLKADDSEYVRKSVANNLNDITKDHPELVKAICKEWIGQNSKTDWIVKHASRTLLRKADPETLSLFGFHHNPTVHIKDLTLSTEQLAIGENFTFQFTVNNPTTDVIKLRVEYGIDFMKANGINKRKLFKITENTYLPGDYTFTRSHSFKNLSTRKHYSGKHQIAIVLNGVEMAGIDFILGEEK